MKQLLLALLMVTVTLAGCADSNSSSSDVEDDLVDKDTYTLSREQGAIDGLLVDDRFRPVDLEEGDGQLGEFQAKGFVLLQETGKRVETNENGEFQFLDLAPGVYTIRVQSDRHEASPKKVEVRAGEFTEQQVLARRVATDNSALISFEYAVFIDCGLVAVIQFTFSCSTDQSGDSFRQGFYADYTSYSDISGLIAEMKANQEKRYEVDLWNFGCESTDETRFYANSFRTSDYVRMRLTVNETNTEYEDIFTNDPWLNECPILTELLPAGRFSEELTGVAGEDMAFFVGGGVDVHLGLKAKFLHSLFLGEPNVDLDTYSVYQ